MKKIINTCVHQSLKFSLIILGTVLFLFSCGQSKPGGDDKTTVADSTSQVKDTTSQVKIPDTFPNYFHLPGPFHYDKKNFKFAWSNHEAQNNYKQFYLPGDDVASKYSELIIVELSLRDIPVKDMVEAKTQELQDRKNTDPIVKFEVGEDKKTGEFMLDFLISSHFSDANPIVEWNIYRYRPYSDKYGQKGIQVFALSKHVYDMDCQKFVDDIGTERKKYISSFMTLTAPEINL